MSSILWVPSAVVVAAALGLYAIRAVRDRMRGRLLTLDIVIQEREISPARAALLTDLFVRTRLQEDPPFTDPNAFERCASERLRDALYRGGDLWREAEELRGLRADLGFETEEAGRMRFLSPILLVAPTGEGTEGVVVARMADHALVAMKQYPGNLQPGVYLSMVEAGAIGGGESAAPVVRLGVWGPYQLVWLNCSETAFRARRRSPRIDCHLEAGVSLGEAKEDESLPSTVVNVSRHGARLQVHTSRDPVPGQQVRLQLFLDGERLEQEGRIAWARRDAGNVQPAGRWILGLEFLPLPAKVWSKILATVLGKRGFASAELLESVREGVA